MRWQPRCMHGFTLIELLVVLVIIGIMVSVAVLSLGDGGKHERLLQEGRRVAALIELASDNAVLQGREWGMRIEADSYSFWVLRDGVWQAAADERMFQPRQLSDGFSLTLHMDDMNVALPTNPADGTHTQVLPQIFLMSSAERTPFQLVLAAPEGTPQLTVEAPPMGAVVIHEQPSH